MQSARSRRSEIRFSDRRLTPAQAVQLLALYRQTFWAADRSLADVRRMLKYTPFMISAWEGRRLIGFARVLTDFTYRASLYDVIVDEHCQGKGIGMKIMQRLQKHPKLRTVTSWYLKTRDSHTFYESLGWKRNAEGFMELRRSTPKRRR